MKTSSFPQAEIAIANAESGSMFDVHADKLAIPYGDYPHAKGVQRFTKQSAEQIVAAWNSIPEQLRMTYTGIPVYIGHPDVPELRTFYPDTKAYGWLEGISAENDAMQMPVKWTAPGAEMIEKGHFKFYSPYWMLKKVAGGISPTRLKSIGLTNNNNIPVPALANETAFKHGPGKTPEDLANHHAKIRREAVATELAKLAGSKLSDSAKYDAAFRIAERKNPESFNFTRGLSMNHLYGEHKPSAV